MFYEVNRGHPRSQGPLYLEKVPRLWLDNVSMYSNQSRTEGGPQLNFVNIVYGRESCAALQTLFWKLSKLFVRDPAWPVLRFYLNFYEYEMVVEWEVCLFFTTFF